MPRMLHRTASRNLRDAGGGQAEFAALLDQLGHSSPDALYSSISNRCSIPVTAGSVRRSSPPRTSSSRAPDRNLTGVVEQQVERGHLTRDMVWWTPV
ncbi:hypothetical protein [Saccharopolyspora hattusasensis]|uniref:hypothetical protein n=1 Tax=Saccharopolyspora hattusasensis TaxID=1128679 RepID=UPI003D98D6CC